MKGEFSHLCAAEVLLIHPCFSGQSYGEAGHWLEPSLSSVLSLGWTYVYILAGYASNSTV